MALALTFKNLFTRSVLAITVALSLVACETQLLDDRASIKPIVLGGEAASDSPLVAEVEKALKQNSQTTLLRINVMAIDDLIILRGTVESDQLMHVAEEVAGKVAGVRHVTNNIYVSN